jgi:hypothetical protein
VSGATASSPSNSLFIRDGATVTSAAFDAAVPAARLQLWIRRGSDSVSGSGRPDAGDDLVVEYYNGTSYVALETFTGSGTAWQTYTRTYDLPLEALHAGLRLQFRMVDGDNTTYWRRSASARAKTSRAASTAGASPQPAAARRARARRRARRPTRCSRAAAWSRS